MIVDVVVVVVVIESFDKQNRHQMKDKNLCLVLRNKMIIIHNNA